MFLETPEGILGNTLMQKEQKAMEINDADVAELVDARDLKTSALVESHQLFCITRPQFTTETDRKRRDLHNAFRGALHHAEDTMALTDDTLLAMSRVEMLASSDLVEARR